MLKLNGESQRALKIVELQADLVVVGGGLAGTCAAITAARQGLKVVLFQDRPVLGGNASSEVRLWTLGATCHMGSNNRWAREGGVIDEILTENHYRNPDGNALIFDTVVLEKVILEPRITLLLNTAVFECGKSAEDADRIAWVRGFCAQNSTMYRADAPLFVDASGDGVLGFMAGAAFRMGAEDAAEFDEGFAPTGDFGHLLGHSMYFYSKDAGRPVHFVPPSYAMPNIPERIPRYRQFNTKDHGCKLWWMEWGGRMDTVHDTETIKWELWRVAYGVWDYIKNSGKFPEAANLTLEWVGQIPGKRESRRFEGPYMLTQRDVVRRPIHEDAVAYGGWSIDLHPADGVFAKIAGSLHLHSKGPYQIPFRCYYSRNVRNLFFAGRNISTSHVAFGSTRVMGTCAHGGQAIGVAAALCRQWNITPAQLSADAAKVQTLRRELLRSGQHIWGERLDDPDDLAASAHVTASSQLQIAEFPADGGIWKAEKMLAQMLPVAAGPVPGVTLDLAVSQACTANFELRTTTRLDHHTPDVILGTQALVLPAGEHVAAKLDFGVSVAELRYVFVCVAKHPHLAVHGSRALVTGLLAVEHHRDEGMPTAPTTPGDQTIYPHAGKAQGGEEFKVFSPRRRPADQNFALRITPPLDMFAPHQVTNGVDRPTYSPNAWIAAANDPAPSLTLAWNQPKTIRRIVLGFDNDFDNSVESVYWPHPENVSPYLVKRYRIRAADGTVLHECRENHLAQNIIDLPQPVHTTALHIDILEMNGAGVAATVQAVRCYA